MENLLDRVRDTLSDRFLVHEEIGQGGMATVYSALDLKTSSEVAIKVLKPEIAATLGKQRFEREIRVTSGLTHPNILPIIDAGEVDGTLYCVLPLVHGETVAQLLGREKQLPIPQVIRIAREVAAALTAAHEAGIVHRDLKPSNVLLEDERVLVTDFGICRALASTDDTTLTESGIAIGTPAFMSPEQASEGHDVVAATDVYSFGCLLYTMLAGEPPFTGATAQAVIARHMVDQPSDIRIVRRTAPDWLADLLATCLEKVPADRFPSGAELLSALEHEEEGHRRRVRAKTTRRILLAAGAIATLVAALFLTRPWSAGGEPPDLNAIVVFPFNESGAGAAWAGSGEAVATMLGYVLDHAEPLRWIEGYDWLTPDERHDPTLVTADSRRRVARRLGAAWYIDGSIIENGDSLVVVARLTNTSNPSRTERAGISVPVATASVGMLAQRSVAGLLQPLIAPYRDVDASAFAGRNLEALTSWLRGESQYRRSQFEEAHASFLEAIEHDSVLAPAALSAAQAANWIHELEGAVDLTELALRHDSLLSESRTVFARGFRAFLTGRADSALGWFQEALKTDSSWSEGWIMVSEVHRELLPSIPGSVRIAEEATRRAYEVDSLFTPAMYQLTEYELRSGRLDAAGALIDRFRRERPQAEYVSMLENGLLCLQEGPEAVDWNAEALRAPGEVLNLALSPAMWRKHFECTEAGLRAVIRSDSAARNEKWGAVLSLQSQLFAQDRLEEVRSLLDDESLISLGTPYVYVIDYGLTGAFEAKAHEVLGSLPDEIGETRSASLWLYGVRAVQDADAYTLGRLTGVFDARADTSGARLDVLLAQVFGGHQALLAGDTATAPELWRDLSPSGPRDVLPWNPWESLGLERLTVARLRLAAGDYAGADSAAALLESTSPVTYPLFAGVAEEIRSAAASASEGR